ncbi:hypothetical protein [Marivirga lumbricoides]|uniref:hypothetical protein n=1 Tax=Marivirga lumbricoides TaxID=1046115 RepID=UPI00166DC021
MIQLIKLLSDFGLLILIWIIQTIVYPSFSYYSSSELLIWHEKYTHLITFIVLPLMATQLFSSCYLTYHEFNWVNSIQLILILIIWFSTFLQAVPLHNQIAVGKDLSENIIKLVQVNWLRTILWSIVFLLSFYNSSKELI